MWEGKGGEGGGGGVRDGQVMIGRIGEESQTTVVVEQGIDFKGIRVSNR